MEDKKDEKKGEKKQKKAGGKNKGKYEAHRYKCAARKDDNVQKSSHGAFLSVADLKARKYADGWVPTKPHPKGWEPGDKVTLDGN